MSATAAPPGTTTASPPSTNRDRNTHDSFPVGRFGVDTITVRGPVDAEAVGQLSRQRIRRIFDPGTGEAIDTITSAEALGPSGVHFIVGTWWAGRPEVQFEFSVPNRIRGDNRVPATPAEVVGALKPVYAEVNASLPWACTLEELTVSRIDIARDFEGVDDGLLLIQELARTPARRMGTTTHHARKGGGVETLVREVRRCSAKLYLREAKYSSPGRFRDGALAAAEAGVVRYELTLRAKAADKAGLGHVGDLRMAALVNVAREYFDRRCRFGDVVAGPAWKVRSAVDQLAATKQSAVMTSLGQLVADAYGVQSHRHEKSVAGYRRDYARVGLTPADLLRPDRPPVRLDFDTGRLVDVAA